VTQASYTNHLLIAMPALTDDDFSHSVTLVCEHSDRGALGIVLNKPSPMMLRDVLSQMKLEARDEQIGGQIVLCGGPMRTDRGFVLHRPGGDWDSTHKGQLEQEIRDNDWLPVPADERLLFNLPFTQRWEASWQFLGVDVEKLSPTAGNA
jgi:putative transcriptional regulator